MLTVSIFKVAIHLSTIAVRQGLVKARANLSLLSKKVKLQKEIKYNKSPGIRTYFFEHTAQIFQIFKKVGVKLYHIFL